MITIFTRENCAYCPMVKKYLDIKGVEYEVKEAEGLQYADLSTKYGYTVPLVYNSVKDDGHVGYNIAKLNALIA